jgi:hypothetical protein
MSSTQVKQFTSTKTHKLHRTNTFLDRMAKEAMEIQLHPSNFNRQHGYTISLAWHLLINLLKHQPHRQARLKQESNQSTCSNVPHSTAAQTGGIGAAQSSCRTTVARFV